MHTSKPPPKTLNMSDSPDKVCWQSSLLCGDWGMAWTWYAKTIVKVCHPRDPFLVKLNSILTNHNLQRDQVWYKCIQSIYISIYYIDQTCTVYLYILLILWQPLHQARTHGARHFQKTVHTFAADNKDRLDKPKSGGFHPTRKILLL